MSTLKPVFFLLSFSFSRYIVDACDIFFDLLNEPVLQDLRQAVQKRFDFVIKPCHLAAYMFHSKYMGQELLQQQVEAVKDWLVERGDDYLPAAIAFQAEAHPFPQCFFRARLMNPVTWWKGIGLSTTDLPDGFLDLMVTLQSAVASSASLERIFCTFGLVMTKLHNRLGLEKA